MLLTATLDGAGGKDSGSNGLSLIEKDKNSSLLPIVSLDAGR